MIEHRAYKNDLPGSRSAPCLGCGRRVVSARDPHCLIAGKRDGSLLIVSEAEPQLSYATTDPDLVFTEPDLYVLGLAHRDCVPLAREQLEAQEVELADELPALLVDDEVGDLPQLHLPPDGNVCAFCGELAASDEHVFPKWVSRALARIAPMNLKTDYGPRPIKSLEITAPVCEKCNTRWLSVLENDVQPILRPLIHGEERVLSPAEQRVLATWAAKTALMLDLASGQPVIPSGFYYDLRLGRRALPSQVVWLGAYRGPQKAIWMEHHARHFGIDTDLPPNGFVTTFIVFRALFQVAGHFTKGGATLNDDRPVAAGLWVISPPRPAPVRWPRGRLAFGDDALAPLAASIT
jgi:hypothetical protein